MNKILPYLWIVLTIFILVLVVPSILVVSFPNNVNQMGAESIDIKKIENDNKLSEPSIEVSVYRTSTEGIETVPLEEYVVGVVASEMPISFELEALKAQSLAARTYIVNQMLSDSNVGIPGDIDVDISDNHIFHQVYKNKNELAKQWGKNYNSNISKIQDAVNATKGKILIYDGNPIDPSFHSTSNGYTENSEDYWKNKIPYLRSVASPWDKESPKFKNQKILTIAEVEQALGINLDQNTDIIGEKKLTKSKRIDTIKIGNKEFSGVEVRKVLGLPSNDFDIQQKNGNLIFTTRGNGHGVGMSQYGANGMAKEGKSYEEIVKYYYKDVSVSSVDPFINTIVVKK